jgi:hypothetical protein
MRKHLYFFLLFYAYNLHAQNFEYNIQLKSVTFSGDGMYALKKDNGSGAIPTDVHWTNDNIINPSAYASGTFVKAKATFEFNCPNAPATVFIRGWAPDSISFPAVEIPVDTGTIEYPVTQASDSFEFHKVRYYESFEIEWEISFDNVHWYHAGTSGSPVYVTWEKAIAESPNPWDSYKYFFIACPPGL